MQSSFYYLNTFALTEVLRYHKHLSTSLIVMDDIIIGKTSDKLVKARDVKVSTKRWRDGSQFTVFISSFLTKYMNIKQTVSLKQWN